MKIAKAANPRDVWADPKYKQQIKADGKFPGISQMGI